MIQDVHGSLSAEYNHTTKVLYSVLPPYFLFLFLRIIYMLEVHFPHSFGIFIHLRGIDMPIRS